MADTPNSKKRKLQEEVATTQQQVNSTEEEEGKMKVVLALCGSFNPPTILHLRLFGQFKAGFVFVSQNMMTLIFLHDH